jgi:putative SOS response-associated peptidase YedK
MHFKKSMAESVRAVQVLLMCGRYRRTTQEEEFARRYGIAIPPQADLPISWNVAPSQDVLAVRFNPKTGQRSLDAIRWGLVPSWAKDEKIGFKTINARVETIDTAPAFRAAFRKRRCLIPADGFYEWKKVLGGKAPFSIALKSGESFAFAGLWEGWKRPGTEDWLRTCTIITGEPNELVREIHSRMPVILPLEYQEGWLIGAAGKEVLTPYPAEEMTAWEISPRVNSPRHNDPTVIDPISLVPSQFFSSL